MKKNNMDMWKQKLLACFNCGIKLQNQAESFRCPQCGTTFLWDNGILVNPDIPKDPAFIYYEKEGGTPLRERAKIKLTTSSFEDATYYAYIKNCFDLPRDEAILDLGCGDGRMTFHLLEMGFTNIVAVDNNIQGLRRLWADLSEEESRKIFLINTDLINLPLEKESIAGTIAIEVLLYLNEKYDAGLKTLYRVMKTNATLFNSDPTLEGALLYFLVHRDLDLLKIAFEQNLKKEKGQLENSVFSRLFKRGEMEKILDRNNFILQHHAGVPVYGNLGSLLLNEVNATLTADEREKWLKLLSEMMINAVPPYRCECFISIKA